MKVIKVILLLAVTIAPIHAMLAPKKASPIVALLNGKMSVEGYLEQLKESPSGYQYWLKVMEMQTADYGNIQSFYSYLVYDIGEDVKFVRKYTRLYRSVINEEIKWDDLTINDQDQLKLYHRYVEQYKGPVSILNALIKRSIDDYMSRLQTHISRGTVRRPGAS